jgi:hypothetical protein
VFEKTGKISFRLREKNSKSHFRLREKNRNPFFKRRRMHPIGTWRTNLYSREKAPPVEVEDRATAP